MLRVHFKNLLKALLAKKQRNVPAQPENSTATAFSQFGAPRRRSTPLTSTQTRLE